MSYYIAPPCLKEIEELYRDEDLLIVNKPDGLFTVPGRGPENRDSVLVRLKDKYPTMTLVHRLDLDTSGILILALSKEATSHINRQFQLRAVNKYYTAVLFGVVKEDEFTISLPIGPDWNDRPRNKIDYEAGKEAVTKVTVLDRDVAGNQTRVVFKPVTGRSHQLRLHSKSIGHPILGCDLYAHEEAFKQANRLMLHATGIGFVHPTKGKWVSWETDVPF